MSLSISVLIIVLFLILFALGAFFGVIWIPTKKKDYERIASLINWNQEQTFLDLGSGTGDLLFFISKKYGMKCIGIEVSPLFYLYSKIKSLFYEKVDIYLGNFFNFNLSNADIIYAFLHPKLLKRLKEKIRKEVKKETLVILSCWPFENMKALKIDKKEKEVSYYLYLIKPDL